MRRSDPLLALSAFGATVGLVGSLLSIACTGYFAPNGAGFQRTQAQRDSARVADSLENWRADSMYKARKDTTQHTEQAP